MTSYRILWGLLAGLSLAGLTTVQSMTSSTAEHIAWGIVLIAIPLMLSLLIWLIWGWTTMACVIYGTIGLALDLSTMTSIMGGSAGETSKLALSGISGFLNLALIVFGGRAFVQSLQRVGHRGCRPPSPPFPSSSGAD